MAQCNGCLKDNTKGFCSSCEKILFNRSKVSPQLKFNWEDISKRIEDNINEKRKNLLLKDKERDLKKDEIRAYINKTRHMLGSPRLSDLERKLYNLKETLEENPS